MGTAASGQTPGVRTQTDSGYEGSCRSRSQEMRRFFPCRHRWSSGLGPLHGLGLDLIGRSASGIIRPLPANRLMRVHSCRSHTI